MEKNIKLTKYPIASFRELCLISFPLMFSALSGSLMFFGDRLIIAFLSKDALNSVASAGMPCYIFQFGLVGIVSIAEVFVGQFNGANKKDRLGEPVWQMLWLCIAVFPIFLLLAHFGANTLIPKEYLKLGKDYFYWLMLLGPFYGAGVALASFFIGQGKTKLVFFSVAGTNVLNLILDWLLVFGVTNIIKPMGAAGAGIATLLSQIVQVLILLIFFFNSENRTNKGTLNWKFNKELFRDCFKIGTPSALGHMMEIGAWTALWHLLSRVSDDHITVFAIGQAFFVLFVFITEGLSKGVVAVASNLIGSSSTDKMSELRKSAVKIIILWVLLMMLPLLIFSEQAVDVFLITEPDIPSVAALKENAKATLFWVWVFFIFDCIAWVHVGFSTAAGDTKFVMVANTVNAVCFAVIPVIIFSIYFHWPPGATWKLVVVYGFINAITFLWRYRSAPWNKKVILKG